MIGKNFENLGQIERWNHHLLEIGDNCLLGTESKIVLHGPILPYRENNKIIFKDMVWVGFRSTILMGTTIGRCSLVGTGAIVRGNFPAYSVIAGNPAKAVSRRTIAEILRFYVIRFLMKRVLGTVEPNWNLLKIEHVKHALGHKTEEPYDENLDLDNMTVQEVMNRFGVQ